MAQSLFAGVTTASTVNLDANFTELYGRGATVAWTPVFNVETGLTGTWTYSSQVGRYTQVGKQVISEFEITWTAKPSAGSVLTIDGMPFGPAVANAVKGGVSHVKGVTFTDGSGNTGSMLTVASYAGPRFCINVAGSGLASADPRLSGPARLASAGYLYGYAVFNA